MVQNAGLTVFEREAVIDLVVIVRVGNRTLQCNRADTLVEGNVSTFRGVTEGTLHVVGQFGGSL